MTGMQHQKPTMQALTGADLTKILHDASHLLAQEAVANEPPTGLVSPKEKAAQLERETNETFEKLSGDFVEGARLLLAEVELLSRVHHNINFDKVSKDLKQMGDHFGKETYDKLALKAVSDEQFNPQDVVKIPQDTLLALFEGAAHILAEKRFAEATKAFALLCTIAPVDYDHWVGYGHSAFHNHNYDVAILAYYMATSLRSNTPWPLIWAANTCEKKNETEAAIDLLLRAKELAHESKDKEIHTLEEQIQTLLSTMQSKMKK